VTHPDVYREIDRAADPAAVIASLETRGRDAAQRRLRGRFLRAIPIRRRAIVLEVGCGTGVIVRDLVRLVGPGGRVAGIDASRAVITAARRLCRGSGVTLRQADAAALPFAAAGFDVTLAVTVLLHVADPLAVVREMTRVTRPGGRVAVQDQDFGTLALAHPDRVLSDRILDGVVNRMYEEPYSGRRLPALLRAAGLRDLRVRADVYQETALTPYMEAFLQRRAENAVRFGLVGPGEAQRWLDGIAAFAEAGTFLFTINYYGAIGVKPRTVRRA
jgi:ubiquinone/menaquinone biosynthesis C-methylase UbiE